MKAKTKGNNAERVIFRKYYDPYMELWCYMCLFQDDEANPNRIAYVDIWKNGEKWWHDCYDEAHMWIAIKKTKIVHKTDPIVPELIEALKKFYGGDYVCVEKIIPRKRS